MSGAVIPTAKTEVTLDPLDRARLLRRHQGDHHAGSTGPSGPSGPVYVVLGVRRRVEVDHGVDPVDVDPPGRHVGGHQGVDRAPDERVQCPVPLFLAAVAVDGRRPDPVAARVGGQSGRRCAWSGRTRWSALRRAATLAVVRPGRRCPASRRDAPRRCCRPGRPRARGGPDRSGSAAPARRRRRRGWRRTAGSGDSRGSGRAAGEHRGGTPCRPCDRLRRGPRSPRRRGRAPPLDEIGQAPGAGHGHVDAPGQGLELRP